jgi:hydroxymethylpyrimidine/phosphomethylpyrimidine kinase
VGWVTPNWNELAILAETPKISTLPEAEQAMHHLGRRHPHLHIVATGGDQAHPTDLFRLPSGQVQAFPGDRIESRATHGTGCAFSSALLAALASGAEPAEAVAAAKHFVREAIRRAPQIGHGKGPMELLWPLRLASDAEDSDISNR